MLLTVCRKHRNHQCSKELYQLYDFKTYWKEQGKALDGTQTSRRFPALSKFRIPQDAGGIK